MKAKQVQKVQDRPRLAETRHRVFNIGEQVRLETVDSNGDYDTGIITERLEDYTGKINHYRVALTEDPAVIVRVGVWFVKGMDSPARPE